MRAEKDREREEQVEAWRIAEAPLVEELRASGLSDVRSSWDLVARSTPYPDALPILVSHLERPYPDRVREGIARALAVPDARFAWANLITLYRAEPAGTDAKDGLAVALAATADNSVTSDLIKVVMDQSNGSSRVLLLAALTHGDGRAILEGLTGDPSLGAEAKRLLARRAI